MFVGHGLLAFAIAASVATRRGWSADRALTLGAVAALFGTLPDIDMLYAVVGLLGGVEGLTDASVSFWAAASVVHRSVTHSLLVGGVAAVGFAAVGADSRRMRLLGVATLTGLAVVATVVSGPLGGMVMTVFAAGGVVITRLARGSGFTTRQVLSVAALGVLSHPFGDLLTGEPPVLLYPLDVRFFVDRIALAGDPTLHLLGALFFELATLWFALFVYARLRGWRVRTHIRRRAVLGTGYAGAVVAVPAPTLELSWPFVFSLLAVGVVAVPLGRPETRRTHWRTLATALTAVTLGALSYTGAYLLL